MQPIKMVKSNLLNGSDNRNKTIGAKINSNYNQIIFFRVTKLDFFVSFTAFHNGNSPENVGRVRLD